MKKAFLILLVLSVLFTPLFAASIGVLRIENLPKSNVTITIDGKTKTINNLYLTKGYQEFKLIQGKHTIVVKAPGKEDFTTTIDVGSKTTITAFDGSAVAEANRPSNTPSSPTQPSNVRPKPITVDLSKKHFVGRGYDYFSEFAMETKLKESVLDFNKMLNADYLQLSKVNKAEISTVYGSTTEEYSKSYQVGAGVEGSYAGFSASLETNFGNSNAQLQIQKLLQQLRVCFIITKRI